MIEIQISASGNFIILGWWVVYMLSYSLISEFHCLFLLPRHIELKKIFFLSPVLLKTWPELAVLAGRGPFFFHFSHQLRMSPWCVDGPKTLGLEGVSRTKSNTKEIQGDKFFLVFFNLIQ